MNDIEADLLIANAKIKKLEQKLAEISGNGAARNRPGKEIVVARNRYAGYCYRCGQYVPVGYGHFERHNGGWRIKCVKCASGRTVSDKDPCVIRARQLAAQAREDGHSGD